MQQTINPKFQASVTHMDALKNVHLLIAGDACNPEGYVAYI